MAFSFVNFLISIYLWYQFDPSTSNFQFVEDREWLKGFINYKVGIDGISILFIVLTSLITPLCIISVNNTIKDRLRDFLIAILIIPCNHLPGLLRLLRLLCDIYAIRVWFAFKHWK